MIFYLYGPPVRTRFGPFFSQGLVVLGALVVAGLLVDWLALRHGNFDARVYRGAVTSWVQGGDLYAFGLGQRHLGFTYPPFAALCMLPMAAGPASVIMALNQLVIVGAVVFSVRVMVGRLPNVARRGVGFVTAFLVPMVFVMQPVRDTLTFGQVNITLAALVLLDLLLIERGSRFAGVGIGLATAIKLTPGLFVVFLLVAGLRRAAGTATATAVGTTLLAALISPSTSWTFWTSAIFDGSRVGSYDSATNQSLAGVLARVANSSQIPLIWLPLMVLFVVLAVRTSAIVWRSGARLAAFTVIGLAASVASPISWIHHLWWVVPALLIVLEAGLLRRSALIVASAVGLAVLFASGLPDLARSKAGHHLTPWALTGENAYALVCIGLVIAIPRLIRHQTVVPRQRGLSELESALAAVVPTGPAAAPA